MPRVELPEDFVSELSTNQYRVLSANTAESGVATYSTKSGQANISLDIQMDGDTFAYTKKMDFALKPKVSCQPDDVYSDAEENSIVAIKVRNTWN